VTEARTLDSPELYVYYRVAQGDRERCVAAVRQFQVALARRHAGLAARVLVKSAAMDAAATDATLMETYARPTDEAGIGDALCAEIEAAAQVLGPWLQGSRHIERFEPCA
jgi:hypothetical protein